MASNVQIDRLGRCPHSPVQLHRSAPAYPCSSELSERNVIVGNASQSQRRLVRHMARDDSTLPLSPWAAELHQLSREGSTSAKMDTSGSCHVPLAREGASFRHPPPPRKYGRTLATKNEGPGPHETRACPAVKRSGRRPMTPNLAPGPNPKYVPAAGNVADNKGRMASPMIMGAGIMGEAMVPEVRHSSRNTSLPEPVQQSSIKNPRQGARNHSHGVLSRSDDRSGRSKPCGPANAHGKQEALVRTPNRNCQWELQQRVSSNAPATAVNDMIDFPHNHRRQECIERTVATNPHLECSAGVISQEDRSVFRCDSQGRCTRHPGVRLRRKKLFGGWKVLMGACPDCCLEEIRRFQSNDESPQVKVISKNRETVKERRRDGKLSIVLKALSNSRRSATGGDAGSAITATTCSLTASCCSVPGGLLREWNQEPVHGSVPGGLLREWNQEPVHGSASATEVEGNPKVVISCHKDGQLDRRRDLTGGRRGARSASTPSYSPVSSKKAERCALGKDALSRDGPVRMHWRSRSESAKRCSEDPDARRHPGRPRGMRLRSLSRVGRRKRGADSSRGSIETTPLRVSHGGQDIHRKELGPARQGAAESVRDSHKSDVNELAMVKRRESSQWKWSSELNDGDTSTRSSSCEDASSTAACADATSYARISSRQDRIINGKESKSRFQSTSEDEDDMRAIVKHDRDSRWSWDLESKGNRCCRGSASVPPSVNDADVKPKDKGRRRSRATNIKYTDARGRRGRYSGEVDRDGFPRGHGVMMYEDGSMREGLWKNGKRGRPKGREGQRRRADQCTGAVDRVRGEVASRQLPRPRSEPPKRCPEGPGPSRHPADSETASPLSWSQVGRGETRPRRSRRSVVSESSLGGRGNDDGGEDGASARAMTKSDGRSEWNWSRELTMGGGRGVGLTARAPSSLTSAVLHVRGMVYSDVDSNRGRYTGAVNEDFLPHGHGTMAYENGAAWEGTWKNGRRRHETRPEN